ncbi:uncharacterized protein Z519_04147 [Cladophialophora bantiana CBS 173.52]|uniref:Uncharacterized protein n=1 Tax=Cladophialophora bantiana (strain ATCC 10958 / CBS 173.52 / CDC B-1940 / NIH 8579) TaxID=1442370 RepID=A0A0D2GAF9_CLAB1|nr:uncharacterized protein Z519_04147 [Cladophialophora bantiana CBS 173.52]KIW95562.1 hypothetical protein Z519_04147 [Cladophialophora bantiana CBS 173.52]
MRYREKKTYFVYGTGYPQDKLCLGNLVLRDYANPTRVRHYTHPNLPDEGRRNHANIIPLPKTTRVKVKKGLNISIGADLVDIVTLKFPWNSTRTRLISAPSGQKIELKNSDSFFHHEVLKNDEARRTLATWVSAAHSDRMNIFRRKPRIWLLTGLYIFRDATCSEIENASAGAEAALSSALVAAAGGPPVGPEVDVSVVKQIETEVPLAGDLVWAAQWTLLNLEGVWYRSGIEGSDSQGWMVPFSISLYPDRFSSGVLKAGASDEIAYLSVRERVLDQDEGQEQLEDLSVQPEDEYDRQLEKAICDFQESVTEQEAKDADPVYQARKKELLDGQRRAYEDFELACEEFPPGSKERRETHQALNEADEAVREFESEL